MTRKEELRELVTKMYQECAEEIIPLFPKVLVRVLPKEQVSKGGIVMPDGAKQNKPTHEGVVLKTFKPFLRKVYLEEFVSADKQKDWKPETEVRYLQEVKSAVEPGDHILFPHIEFGITPVWPLDGGDGDYRLVPEDQIIARVDYTERPDKLVPVTTSGA